VIAFIFSLYAYQFIVSSMDKGPMRLGGALRMLGFHAAERLNTEEPRIKVVRAWGEAFRCDAWNFEETWGRCANIWVEVKDYDPTQRAAVERRIFMLAKQLSEPCKLNEELALEHKERISEFLECNSNWKPFRITMKVRSVKLLSDKINPADPFMWKSQDLGEIMIIKMKGNI
jgi:hypothetical protein